MTAPAWTASDLWISVDNSPSIEAIGHEYAGVGSGSLCSEWIVGNPPTAATSRSWLNANSVVDGRRNALRAAQVALRRLNRDVAEEKLNLLQLSACSAAQACAGATLMPHAA
jgi:hypothetical protein